MHNTKHPDEARRPVLPHRVRTFTIIASLAMLSICGTAAAGSFRSCNSCNIGLPVPDGDAFNGQTTLGLLTNLRNAGRFNDAPSGNLEICNSMRIKEKSQTNCGVYHISNTSPNGFSGYSIGIPDDLCKLTYTRQQSYSVPCTYPDNEQPGSPGFPAPSGLPSDFFTPGAPIYICSGRLSCY